MISWVFFFIFLIELPFAIIAVRQEKGLSRAFWCAVILIIISGVAFQIAEIAS